MASSSLISVITSEADEASFSDALLYCYQIYGLTIRSELPLPQLLPGIEQAAADVVVRYGPLPESLEHPIHAGIEWQASQDEFLFSVPDVARYWIYQGKEIWIEPAPLANEADVRTFLLGSSMGILLHQRHIWALHASAVKTDQGAVLFTGPSGAGKSTTLSGMLNRGYAMVADDVSGIVIDKLGYPQVLSAFPHRRLWANTAEQLGLSIEGIPRVRKSLDKFLFPVDNFSPGIFPLRRVYALVPHGKPEIELIPIDNVSKFSCLFSNTYRRQFVQSVGWGAGHFQLITEALQRIEVVAIRRPKHDFLLDELLDCIEADMAQGKG